MSRVGKKPIPILSGVKVKIDGNVVEASGKEGTLKNTFNLENVVKIEVEGENILVKRTTETPRAHAVQGLIRSLINNMIEGVANGYTKMLDVVGVGYKAELKGSILTVNAGYSHAVDFPIPTGLKVTVDKQTRITIKGCDKWLVGETAASIRKIRKPEPYKGKGIRFADEVIKRKVGKTAVGSGG